MRDRGWLTVGLAAVLVLCFTHTAWAQPIGMAPKERLRAINKLSPEEMRTKASEHIGSMKKVRDEVVGLRKETADDEGDMVKLGCVNDKLGSIRGFLKVSEQSNQKIDQALSANDRDTANHQFSLIDIAQTKVSALGIEAQSCAGEILQYSGSTQLTADIDPDIADLTDDELIEKAGDIYDITEATPFQ